MEILRFDEPDAPTPKRKRPSKAWLALSMVAALMGVGTAFASSTITVNTNNLTPLGQGVTSVVTCDDNIGVSPNSQLIFPNTGDDHNPAFELRTLSIGTTEDYLIEPSCSGKIFKITLYNSDKSQITCPQMKYYGVYDSLGGMLDTNSSDCTDVTSPEASHAIFFKMAGTVEAPVSDATFYTIRFDEGFKLADLDLSHITLETVASHSFS